MGGLSRNKGKTFEREVRNLLAPLFDCIEGAESPVQRTQQSRGAKDGPDVITPLFWVEAKFGQSPSYADPGKCLIQAMNDRQACGKRETKNLLPLAVTKINRGKIQFSMYVHDFTVLIAKLDGVDITCDTGVESVTLSAPHFLSLLGQRRKALNTLAKVHHHLPPS